MLISELRCSDKTKKGASMVKILFSKEIAERLNVSISTLHKKDFQHRIGLPPNKIGNRIAIPEPIYDEWILNPSKDRGNE